MKHPEIKVAHILATPLQNHGGLNLLVRELVVGLAPYFHTLVLSPKGLPDFTLPREVQDSCVHLPWADCATDSEIEAAIRKSVSCHEINVVIFHSGEFGWGSQRGRKSLLNRLEDLPIKSFYVNHQSSPWFCHLPTIQNPSAIPTWRSALTFARSVFFKHLQLYDTELEICVSRAERRLARSRYFLFRKKFHLIYHSRMRLADVPEHTRDSKRKLILSVGHFAFRKGQHVLIEAFGRIARSYPTWTLMLVGGSTHNDYSGFLHDIIEKYGIATQVELVTETHDPDIHFRHAAIYVQPSLSEAYGLALQEAQGFGCACIGSNTGGIPDSIVDRSFLYPPGNSDALAVILERLMQNEQLLISTQQQSRVDFDAHNRTYENMIAEYRRTIENIY